MGRNSRKAKLHACSSSGTYAGVLKLGCHYIDCWDWHWLCVQTCSAGVELLAFLAELDAAGSRGRSGMGWNSDICVADQRPANDLTELARLGADVLMVVFPTSFPSVGLVQEPFGFGGFQWENRARLLPNLPSNQTNPFYLEVQWRSPVRDRQVSCLRCSW